MAKLGWKRKGKLPFHPARRREGSPGQPGALPGEGEHLREAHSNQTPLKSRSYFASGNNTSLNSGDGAMQITRRIFAAGWGALSPEPLAPARGVPREAHEPPATAPGPFQGTRRRSQSVGHPPGPLPRAPPGITYKKR